jgi:hypothetical protein
MIYREIYLQLTGAPTLTAVNNTQAKTLIGDEWGVVRRIQLIANNTDVLKSLTGNQLWWLNYFLYGTPPPVTPAIGDEATANAPFESTLILPCWLPRSVRPFDTALDARELSDLKLEIQWGNYDDINGDASAWTTEPQINVYSLESFLASGPFSQYRAYSMEDAITATNPQFEILLPVGPMYRSFLINTTDAGKDSALILNNLKVISGSTVYADLDAELLHQMTRLRGSTVRFWSDSDDAYDPLRRGSTYNDIDGWYYLDLVTDGFNTEAIDTLGFSEFKLELDVTIGGVEPTRVHVIPNTIIPVRGGK